jgi:hypothetical protein
MAYDHRVKAGNQGDVVKHVALIAMTRHALAATRSVFKYADAYAGPAGSVLLPGGEWINGVGQVNRSGDLSSQDVRRWIGWYLARPQLIGYRYPGSALIVSDVATEAERFKQVSTLPSTYRTRVLWAQGGRTIGCLLVYRASVEAVASVRAAVDEVVSSCRWTRQDIEHFDPADLLGDTRSTEVVTTRDGPMALEAVDQESDRRASELPIPLSVVSLICGDSHSLWFSHQGAAEADVFIQLRDLLQKSPSRSRRCDVSFDGGQTWVSLVLRAISESQVAWKGLSANASLAARVRVLIRV